MGMATANKGGAEAGRSKTRIAIVNFFKGLFGAGILALPNAFESTGVPLGVVCYILVAAICLITMLLLLDCQRIVRERQGIEVESYEQLAGVIFGPLGFRTVQVLMSLLTLIFCTGFVYAISTNLIQVFPGLSRRVFCLAVFPPLVGLSWISYMKDLWMTSIFGLAVYMVGVVGVTVYYSSIRYEAHAGAMDVRWEGLPKFFGSAVYALEGINLTLPIAASMKSRRRPPLVMTVGLLGFAVVSLFYSAYSYSAGLGGCDIITTCLEPGLLTTTVRIALSVSLLATHPVYLIVASAILESAILGENPVAASASSSSSGAPGGYADVVSEEEEDEKEEMTRPGADSSNLHSSVTSGSSSSITSSASSSSSSSANSWSYPVKARVIRTVEVGLTCLLAAVVPDFGLFTALVGSSALTFIGFIMPTCMWLRLCREDNRNATWLVRFGRYTLAAIILAIGAIAMVVGTKEAIVQLMRS